MTSFNVIDHVFQILILSDGKIPEKLPDFIEKNKIKIEEMYSNSTYKIWSGDEVRQVISENFSNDVLEAYDCLKPFAYKADLARYVLLYLYGGLYIDIGISLKKKWNIPQQYEVAACRDLPFVTPTWIAIQNGLLWARPKRKEFLNAINYIVLNCKNKYYGINPLYPTGPVLLGRAFISSFLEKKLGYECFDQYVGECRPITPDNDVKNLTYVSKSGDVIAFRKKKIPGDISHLGIKNGNNYNFMWQSKTVYGENPEDTVIETWSAAGPEIQATSHALQDKNGIHIRNTKGRVTYGPYIRLPAGSYAIKLYFSPDTKFISVVVEISQGAGSNILYRFRKFKFKMEKDFSLTFPFELVKMMDKIEFRVCVGKNFSGSILNYKLLHND